MCQQITNFTSGKINQNRKVISLESIPKINRRKIIHSWYSTMKNNKGTSESIGQESTIIEV